MAFPPLSMNFSHADKNVMELYTAMASALGVKRMSLAAGSLSQMVEDPGYAMTVRRALARHHIDIVDAHAPHDIRDSLGNLVDPEYSTRILRQSLQSASEIGVRVLTVHVARTRLVRQFAPASGPVEAVDPDGALDRIRRQLEILLPEAEKLGIVIALENLFLPTSTAAFLMRIMEKVRHPHLGLCYDSGHALIVEEKPGKTPDQIADWIRYGWDDDTVTFQSEQLDIMLEHVVTTHFHDNDGTGDLHRLPGDGIADWAGIARKLKNAPRLISVQSEVASNFLTEDLDRTFRQFAQAGFPVSGE